MTDVYWQAVATDFFMIRAARRNGTYLPWIYISFWIADPAWKSYHRRAMSPPVVPHS